METKETENKENRGESANQQNVQKLRNCNRNANLFVFLMFQI